ncbi:MAG: FecR domain-containing protein [Azonexus sp.]|nr:FecR domain-containing protein [Azonexus sp.]
MRLTFLVVLLSSLSLPVLAVDDAGIVKTLQGPVQIVRSGNPRDVTVGDPVQAGDRVLVGKGGSVGISMRDETLISLGPNSVFDIRAFAYNPTTREGEVDTSIIRGSLRYVTGLIGKLNPRAVKVSTPTATIGIRGTEFIVDVPDEN